MPTVNLQRKVDLPAVYRGLISKPFSSLLFLPSRLPLYKAVFDRFRRCHVERKVPVLLPGVMLKGQAQVQVSLHRHICVQLCASVAALLPEHFPMLVRSAHGLKQDAAFSKIPHKSELSDGE